MKNNSNRQESDPENKKQKAMKLWSVTFISSTSITTLSRYQLLPVHYNQLCFIFKSFCNNNKCISRIAILGGTKKHINMYGLILCFKLPAIVLKYLTNEQDFLI